MKCSRGQDCLSARATHTTYILPIINLILPQQKKLHEDYICIQFSPKKIAAIILTTRFTPTLTVLITASSFDGSDLIKYIHLGEWRSASRAATTCGLYIPRPTRCRSRRHSTFYRDRTGIPDAVRLKPTVRSCGRIGYGYDDVEMTTTQLPEKTTGKRAETPWLNAPLARWKRSDASFLASGSCVYRSLIIDKDGLAHSFHGVLLFLSLLLLQCSDANARRKQRLHSFFLRERRGRG